MFRIFKEGEPAPPLFSNMPPVAGALRWSKGLITRIETPREKLKKVPQSVSR